MRTEGESQRPGLLRRLRERSLFRILVAYLAAGWVGLEVIDQLTDQGVIPAVAYQVALIWYLFGIAGALIVGWYHGEKGKQRAPRAEIALLSVVLIFAVTASAGPVSDEISRRIRVRAAAANELEMRRIAVLYFDDLTPGGEAQHLADGLTESLIDELQTVRALDVVSRNGVLPFRDSALAPDSIARMLETGTVVDGSLEQVGEDRLRLSLHLLDGQSGAVFSSTAFEKPTSELLAASDELAQQAALLLRDWLGDQVDLRRTRRATESVPAWSLYQRAEKARKDAELALEQHDGHGAANAFDRADQLLSQAELVDAQWAEPSVLRARIAYRRARIAALSEPHEAVEWIRAGLDHAERALAVRPNLAEALEMRGSLKYLHHLLGIEPDPELDRALFAEGRADLERAVSTDPTLASAHATLSHLYISSDLAASVLAGRRAFEEDAYVENGQAVLWRLVNGLYNLEQFTESRRWCEEGSQRFAGDHRFVVCQLLLLTTSAHVPDPERAWGLLERLDSLAPEHQADWELTRGEMLVAGVLARSDLPDSARTVLVRAARSVRPETDPGGFLYSLEAYIRTLIGDEEEAISILRRHVAASQTADLEGNWWWRSLRAHPDFEELLALNGHH